MQARPCLFNSRSENCPNLRPGSKYYVRDYVHLLPTCLAVELSVHQAVQLGRAQLAVLSNPRVSSSHRRILLVLTIIFQHRLMLRSSAPLLPSTVAPDTDLCTARGTGRQDPSNTCTCTAFCGGTGACTCPCGRTRIRATRALTRASTRPFLRRSWSGRTRRSGCGRSWGDRACCRPVRDGYVAAAVGAEKPNGRLIAPQRLRVDAPEPAVFSQCCGWPRASII